MKKIGSNYLQRKEEKRFVRKYEFIISGCCCLILPVWSLLEGKVIGRHTFTREESPEVFWFSVLFMFSLSLLLFILHFIGKVKRETIGNRLNSNINGKTTSKYNKHNK